MNNIIVSGRSVKEIEIKFTPAGKSVASGTIAVQRNYKVEGEYPTDFLDFVCWGNGAKVLADYVKKGDHFTISGPLQTRTYENNEGRKVKVHEINVRDFDLPVKPRNSDSQQQAPRYNADPGDPFQGNSEPFDVSSDDLPF
ncbi:single-stranded DNA-binding protein [Pseudobacillus sp. FSL P4-0506]|uniref:single-stranded DNA-binding protein n=1 Tax=Pseudobacillus sp. FSL P4-0506 TaxID=2921576 RepID=UPI0030FA484C